MSQRRVTGAAIGAMSLVFAFLCVHTVRIHAAAPEPAGTTRIYYVANDQVQ